MRNNFNSFRWMLLYLAVQINLCLCANLPDSITLIVPVNGSVYLGGPGTIVAATFGVNYTNTALQTGYTDNTTFYFTRPNGTHSLAGSIWSPCQIYPGVFTITEDVNQSGIYTVTVIKTFGLPASGQICAANSTFSYQSEVVAYNFTVGPRSNFANGGSNGTQTSVTMAFPAKPTGSYQNSAPSVRHPQTSWLFFCALTSLGLFAML